MTKTIFLVASMVVAMALSGCSDEDGAREALKAQGYTNIEITGWAPFSCSEDDTWKTGFIADSVNGTRVEGVVCSGFFFKGTTIRTY